MGYLPHLRWKRIIYDLSWFHFLFLFFMSEPWRLTGGKSLLRSTVDEFLSREPALKKSAVDEFIGL